MSSTYGKNFKMSVFGQSHSAAIGVVIDGLPAGMEIDMDALRAFMARRAPGGRFATARKEADEFEILSGVANGRTCGAPFAAQIRNKDTRPGDYSAYRDTPRPGHADYTAQIKYKGFQDPTGGGHFSGRLTAPICLAGGIMRQLLEQSGIRLAAHIQSIADVCDRHFNPMDPEIDAVSVGPLPTLDPVSGEKMAERIEAARMACDSVGGVIECAVTGLPVGLGDPMFDGMENRIAQAAFAIPAVKGIEFGAGFESARLMGSQNNDPFVAKSGAVSTATNNSGGILGGITNGMPLIFRVAIKPTPSIAREQDTVDLRENSQAKISVKGRHDPCILSRAVPCIEAVAAIAIYDALLEHKKEI